jgi:hypothetical protein
MAIVGAAASENRKTVSIESGSRTNDAKARVV